jgi:hypothetical protein
MYRVIISELRVSVLAAVADLHAGDLLHPQKLGNTRTNLASGASFLRQKSRLLAGKKGSESLPR